MPRGRFLVKGWRQDLPAYLPPAYSDEVVRPFERSPPPPLAQEEAVENGVGEDDDDVQCWTGRGPSTEALADTPQEA